jgi:hypothetical protein
MHLFLSADVKRCSRAGFIFWGFRDTFSPSPEASLSAAVKIFIELSFVDQRF